MKDFHKSLFSITAHCTTDILGMEQFLVCVRYANENFDLEEVFLGTYNAPDSTANTLLCYQGRRSPI